jgi:hypothetical protein
MIVLDTNVVSEAMKPEPNPIVRSWLTEQVAQTLHLSSVTLCAQSGGSDECHSGDCRVPDAARYCSREAGKIRGWLQTVGLWSIDSRLAALHDADDVRCQLPLAV